MAQFKIPLVRKTRPHAYENLVSSLDTENDLDDQTLENLTSFDADRQ